MSFSPVNKLERLLIDAAEDPAARPAFYREILDEELFVITEGQTPEREREFVTDKDTSFQLRLLEIEDKLYVPIFTSVERISAIIPNKMGFAAMKGRDVLAMLRGKELVLNPGADYGKMFSPEEVEGILDGSIFNPQERLGAGTKILIGEPAEFPQHIADALSSYFKRSHEVKTAYLALAFVDEADKQPDTMIGLEASGDWNRIVEEAGLVVRQVIKPGEAVGFVHVGESSDDFVSSFLRQHIKPFYKRKKWFGIF